MESRTTTLEHSAAPSITETAVSTPLNRSRSRISQTHLKEDFAPTLLTSTTPRGGFFDKTPEAAAARRTYLTLFGAGLVAVVLVIFAVFSIFWGSLWKTPSHSLSGWVVDFDGGFVGQNISQALIATKAQGKIDWEVVPASEFPNGPVELMEAIRGEGAWAAISINPGSTARLTAALSSADPSYNGSLAITAYGVEARNENGYRNLIRPTIQASLGAITAQFSQKVVASIANSPNLPSILSTSPQTVTAPVAYTLDNIVPFNQPVATAATFVGMLYQIVLGVFVVGITLEAREVSGLAKSLSTRSLIFLRFASSFFAYFVISLFYSLLNLAFALDVTRKYGNAGFLVFWAINFLGITACSLILEALILVLTQKGLPFFMLTWMIINLAVSTFPLDALPGIFKYGYGVPFWNMSRALRTVVFGTDERMGQSVGVLLAWVVVGAGLLVLVQWRARAREARVMGRREEVSMESEKDARRSQDEVV